MLPDSATLLRLDIPLHCLKLKNLGLFPLAVSYGRGSSEELCDIERTEGRADRGAATPVDDAATDIGRAAVDVKDRTEGAFGVVRTESFADALLLTLGRAVFSRLRFDFSSSLRSTRSMIRPF
jgi:hypothetical protein